MQRDWKCRKQNLSSVFLQRDRTTPLAWAGDWPLKPPGAIESLRVAEQSLEKRVAQVVVCSVACQCQVIWLSGAQGLAFEVRFCFESTPELGPQLDNHPQALSRNTRRAALRDAEGLGLELGFRQGKCRNQYVAQSNGLPVLGKGEFDGFEDDAITFR